MRIPTEEAVFDERSYADAAGRIFRWRGGLYRALRSDRAEFYIDLLCSDAGRELIGRGLITRAELTPLELDGYGAVLEHRPVPFVSYAHEWCAEMLRAAALHVLELEAELARRKLTLVDGHPGNVLFDGARPVHVDLGSIVPETPGAAWPAYEEFRRFFLNPLRLMSAGHGRIARWLLHDHERGIEDAEADVLGGRAGTARRALRRAQAVARRAIPAAIRPRLSQSARRLRRVLPLGGGGPRERLLSRMRRELERLSLPRITTEWSDYQANYSPALDPSREWLAKHSSVHQLLSRLRPRTVLDIASNRGWFSRLAAHEGAQVVAFDRDETAITMLHAQARQDEAPVLPLIIDLRRPSPGLGLCNRALAAATERFRTDLTLALGLVHHLAFAQGLTLEQIAEALAAFTPARLCVEFAPAEDLHVARWHARPRGPYDLASFREALGRHFGEFDLLPSAPEPRVLLVCERR
jgi:SAM-dependent methyltransferase